MFLPLMGGMSLFDAFSLAPAQVLLTGAGFILGIVFGAMSLNKPLGRTFAIICAAGFALSTIKLLDAFSAGIGGKLMFIAAIIGLIASIAVIVKPGEATA